MLFLLYFGRKRPWKRDILGRAGYICRMRKKLLVLMAGAASIAGPVQAQFNTVSTVPSRYRVEVVSAGRDNVATLPGNMLSVQDSLPSAGDAAPALPADTCKHVWIERYLSVSYPLHRMKINSLYGYRKDPFTGKNEVSQRNRPPRTGRRGDGHDGGSGSESRAGQILRQVCDLTAWRLHGQLLPPVAYPYPERGCYRAEGCRRYYRFYRTQHQRTPAYFLQARWKKCRSVNGTGLHQVHTRRVRGGTGRIQRGPRISPAGGKHR